MHEPTERPAARHKQTEGQGSGSRDATQAGAVATETEAPRTNLKWLGDRIVEISARIQVAQYQLLRLICEFDEREGWNTGFMSCAHWLNWNTGLGMCAAREKVRVARALGELPVISEAMSRGELSYSKVRALTRVATPDNEEELLDFAKAGSAAHVERLVRSWRRVERLEEAGRDSRRRDSRSLTTYFDEDGMLVVRGRLEPETGAVFLRALEAASDRLYEKGREDSETTGDKPEPQHLRADSLGLVAESALSSGLDPGTRGDRYLVTLYVDAPVLEDSERGSQAGMAMLDDAVDVSAETSRRLSCDCALVTMSHDSEGTILDVGRKRRTVTPALRRALRARDRTCRFPGCANRICDAHHVKHWADGGETKLDNLLLLCRRHHVAVHEEGYLIEIQPDGEPRFFHPTGWEIKQAPDPLPGIDDDPLLDDFVKTEGVKVGPLTGAATCDEGPVDYDVALWHVMPPPDDEDPDGESEPGATDEIQRNRDLPPEDSAEADGAIQRNRDLPPEGSAEADDAIPSDPATRREIPDSEAKRNFTDPETEAIPRNRRDGGIGEPPSDTSLPP